MGLSAALSALTGADGLQLRRRGFDCDGIAARDSIAVGCHWVTCGVVWMGCGAALHWDGDCNEIVFCFFVGCFILRGCLRW